MEYRKYLQSGAWRKRRKAILKRANGLCEKCGKQPPRDVHHRSYLHLGDERDDELMAVCQSCHRDLEIAAGGYYGRPKRKRRAGGKEGSRRPKMRRRVKRPQRQPAKPKRVQWKMRGTPVDRGEHPPEPIRTEPPMVDHRWKILASYGR